MRYSTYFFTSQLISILVLSVVLIPTNDAVGEASLPDIHPVPQHVEWLQGTPAQLDIQTIGSIVVSSSVGPIQAGIDHITERLAEIGRAAIPVSGTQQEPGAAGTLYLGLKGDRDWSSSMWVTSPECAEGYRLVVNANSIVIVGEDMAGLYYGLTTLRQMIQADGSVAQLAIQDWPALPFRGVHVANAFTPESRVRPCSLYKFNALVAESDSLYNLDQPSAQQRWQDVSNLCSNNSMEFIPQLQSLGWGYSILSREPRAVEGAYADRIWFRVAAGVLTLSGPWSDSISPLCNVIISTASPFVVQNDNVSVTYTEGVDYTITPGSSLTFPYTPQTTPLTIRALAGGALQEGQQVRVSYNYARPAGAFTMACCPSEPLYQEFMRNAINRVVQTLHPRHIHIGHDEAMVMNRDKRCTSRGLTNAELFVEDVTRMNDYAKAADPNVRLMMWNDMINPWQNAPSVHLETAAQNIPRDIIMCGWYYGYPYNNTAIGTSVPFFTGLGFDVTGSPWFDTQNAAFWGQYMLSHRQATTHSLGLLYTTWPDAPATDPWAAMATTAEYAWSGGKSAVSLATPLDSDNDTLSNIQESTGDTDADGIPDYLDNDSDNDGVPDRIEVSLGTSPYDSSQPESAPATGRWEMMLLILLGCGVLCRKTIAQRARGSIR